MSTREDVAAWLAENPSIRVYCDNGHRRWWIEQFFRYEGQWRPRWDDKRNETVKGPGGLPGPRTDLDAHIFEQVHGQRPWTTYDLTCPRCKRRKRHVTYARRADDFQTVADELHAAGHRDVTPAQLLAHETRRRGTLSH